MARKASSPAKVGAAPLGAETAEAQAAHQRAKLSLEEQSTFTESYTVRARGQVSPLAQQTGPKFSNFVPVGYVEPKHTVTIESRTGQFELFAGCFVASADARVGKTLWARTLQAKLGGLSLYVYEARSAPISWDDLEAWKAKRGFDPSLFWSDAPWTPAAFNREHAELYREVRAPKEAGAATLAERQKMEAEDLEQHTKAATIFASSRDILADVMWVLQEIRPKLLILDSVNVPLKTWSLYGVPTTTMPGGLSSAEFTLLGRLNQMAVFAGCSLICTVTSSLFAYAPLFEGVTEGLITIRSPNEVVIVHRGALRKGARVRAPEVMTFDTSEVQATL